LVLVGLVGAVAVATVLSAVLPGSGARWLVAAIATAAAMGLGAVGLATLRQPLIRPLDAITSAAHALQSSPAHNPGAGMDPAEVERSLRDSIEASGDVQSAAREAVEQGTILAVQVRSLMSRDLGDYPADWTVAAGVRPAEGVVAGDCFDVGLLTASTIGLLVLDIAGHGALSAFAALRCKDLLKAGLRSGMEPGQACGWLMQQDHGLDGTFLTAFVAIIDVRTGEMRYANAGHPDAIVRDGSSLTMLSPTGPILGPIPATWATNRARVPVGGTLVVYTDGLTEARDDQRSFYGAERLGEVVGRLECSEAQPFVEHLLHDLDTFQPARFADDVTLVVACRLDPAAGAAGCDPIEVGTGVAMDTAGTARVAELPATTTAPRLARAFVIETLEEWGLASLNDTASLLVSEVVTNAVVHAESASTLRIERADGCVHVTVRDSGTGLAGRAEARPGVAGGHGLSLVEALSTDWGARRVDGGHEVWFDLDDDPDRSPR
jgi:anti-sigma regulatory factor (Ser/Thr protein kinase)